MAVLQRLSTNLPFTKHCLLDGSNPIVDLVLVRHGQRHFGATNSSNPDNPTLASDLVLGHEHNTISTNLYAFKLTLISTCGLEHVEVRHKLRCRRRGVACEGRMGGG